MKTLRHKYEQGGVSGSMIAIIGLVVLVLVTGSLAIWAYISFTEQKTDVDGKIDLAVAKAKNDQQTIDDKKFAEREKEPNRTFVGPDELGRLTFSYPKTWSVFVSEDASKGTTYHAYLNPVTVPPISEKQQYALRVTIEQKDYDQVVKTYQEKVKKGDLRSSATSANGHNGTRLDGTFSKDIRGAAVIYQIRDKTVTLRTDADTFKPDFEALIKTIDFNQ
ncbi:MAG TPA: hypothetical protein VFS14_04825 [Candidatus Saccharimonadales bacterium]|nr:hypothetical protein [Candidatus Saccharimonadales bacterium]